MIEKNTSKETPSKFDVILSGDGGGSAGEKRVVKRTSSCPPGRVRSTQYGPWSLEWVDDIKNMTLTNKE